MLQLLSQIASIGVPLAQSFLSSRRQDELAKRMAEAQRHANLVNLLSRGRVQSNPVVKAPKKGLLENLLGAANIGLQAANTYQQGRKADKLFDSQMQAAEDLSALRKDQRATAALERDKIYGAAKYGSFAQRQSADNTRKAQAIAAGDHAGMMPRLSVSKLFGTDSNFFQPKTAGETVGFNAAKQTAEVANQAKLDAVHNRQLDLDNLRLQHDELDFKKQKEFNSFFKGLTPTTTTEPDPFSLEKRAKAWGTYYGQLRPNQDVNAYTEAATTQGFKGPAMHIAVNAAMNTSKSDSQSKALEKTALTDRQRQELAARKQTLDMIDATLNIVQNAPDLIGPLDNLKPGWWHGELGSALRKEIEKYTTALQLSAGNELVRGALTKPQEDQVTQMIGSLSDLQGGFINGLIGLKAMYSNAFRNAGTGLDLSTYDKPRQPSRAETRLMINKARTGDRTALDWLERFAPDMIERY